MPGAGRRRPFGGRIGRVPSALALALVAAGCASASYDSVDLMPAPALYAGAGYDPFTSLTPESFAELGALNYVTDRRPAEPEEPQRFYADERGYLTRVGVAEIRSTPRFRSWDEVRDVTLSGRRDAERTLRVEGIEEFGVLPAGLTPFHVGAPAPEEMEAVARTFSDRIDRQMALSGLRDVFIYVHGYNVNFEYPLLVSKEMQHYLGYRGAFIAFTWPATPSRFAYFKDLGTIEPSARTLRSLIEFLRERTDAERIHLIGYSAGSRLVFNAAYQLALASRRSEGADESRLASIVLVGSDLDPVHFLQGVADGLLDVSDRIAVYMSSSDAALGLSRTVLSQRRLGEIWSPEQIPRELEERLIEIEGLELIDVSFADGAGAGNGHWYFRSSPWVSSDVYLSLMTGLGPDQRGLARDVADAVWRFPDDYLDRLDLSVSEIPNAAPRASRDQSARSP